ncbi:MAG: hypothetical protein QOH31_2260 [Verrucomicrobiota bacterium]
MAFVIKGAVLPKAEDDADPFKGQGAHSGMVRFTSSKEFLITSLGPGGVRDGMSSKFVESLAEELAATPAPSDGLGLTAAIQQRGRSRSFSAFRWGDSAQHDWSQRRPSSRGANRGPAPGKLSQIRGSGCWAKSAWMALSKAATEACKVSSWLTKRCRLKTEGRMRARSSVTA